jgi:hypothetical protein
VTIWSSWLTEAGNGHDVQGLPGGGVRGAYVNGETGENGLRSSTCFPHSGTAN